MSKKELGRIVAFATQGKWADVLGQTEDLDALVIQPRLFGLRLEAALALGDVPVIQATASFAAATDMTPQQRYATIRPLFGSSHARQAWKVLCGDSEIFKDGGFLKQAERIYKYASQDYILRSQIKAQLKKLYPHAVESKMAEVQFKPDHEVSDRAVGSCSVTASSKTNLKHTEGFELEYARLLKMVKAPKIPGAHEYHNVFLDRYGQIWGENGGIVQTTGKSIHARRQEDCVTIDYAVSGLIATRGIYHWLVDRIPHFGVIEPDVESLPQIIIWDGGPKFERESLGLAGFNDMQVREVNDIVFVKRLIKPDVAFAGLRHWSKTGPIFERMAAAAGVIARRENFEGPSKVYISRRDSDRRPLVNEEKVEKILQARGFTSVLLSELPLWKQVALVAKATKIIAPHGAGLAHLVFANPGAKVLELLPIMDNAYRLRFNYARLSTVLGLNYQAWLEPQPPQTDRWHLEEVEFVQFLDGWLGE